MKSSYYWFAAFAVLALWLATFGIVYFKWGNHLLASYGQFGDSFGAATSLFTGLGLLGLLYQLHQQEQGEDALRSQRLLETRIAAVSAALEAKSILANQLNLLLDQAADDLSIEYAEEDSLKKTQQGLMKEIQELNREVDQLLVQLRANDKLNPGGATQE